MKSIIRESEKTNQYPILKIGKGSRSIVLFTAPCTGVVLNHEKTFARGYTSKTFNENEFEIFNGTIELMND